MAWSWQRIQWKIYLTWLPQGIKNSSTIINEALHEDHGEYWRAHPKTTLLQPVDDLLVATEILEECQRSKEDLLMPLGVLGYQASAKKDQVCQQKVTYFSTFWRGQCWLSEDRRETLLKIPTVTSRREVWLILRSTSLCHLWIMKSPNKEIFKRTEAQEDSFNGLKQSLLMAPALGLPDVTKSFHLCGLEQRHSQMTLKPVARPVKQACGYLSKKQDPMVSEWLSCFCSIRATDLQVKDTDKLTLGNELCISTPCHQRDP